MLYLYQKAHNVTAIRGNYLLIKLNEFLALFEKKSFCNSNMHSNSINFLSFFFIIICIIRICIIWNNFMKKQIIKKKKKKSY